jgi:hypothetical protein
MLQRVQISIVVLVALTCAAAAPAGRVGGTTQPTTFVRFIENDDGSARLEAADAAYRNTDGVVVHLIGAVHIGDPIYYSGLNESFEGYDALLYELVKPKGGGVPRPGQQSGHWIGNVQHFMKDRLGLMFQLDGIDYRKPNFVHADLDVETFTKLQDERGESMFTLMLQSALRSMAKGASGAGSGGDPLTGFELLAALGSPDQARQLKLVLARQFADIDDAMAGMEGENGSVLLTERNKAAMKVLDQQIAGGKRRLGIFYGAGHLKLMEQTLFERGFKKVGVTWRTAWEIDRAAPVSRAPTTQRSSTRPASTVTPSGRS